MQPRKAGERHALREQRLRRVGARIGLGQFISEHREAAIGDRRQQRRLVLEVPIGPMAETPAARATARRPGASPSGSTRSSAAISNAARGRLPIQIPFDISFTVYTYLLTPYTSTGVLSMVPKTIKTVLGQIGYDDPRRGPISRRRCCGRACFPITPCGISKSKLCAMRVGERWRSIHPVMGAAPAPVARSR